MSAETLSRPSSRLGAESPSPLYEQASAVPYAGLVASGPWQPGLGPVKVTVKDNRSEVAEIQKILRGIPSESPRTTFFGVSPPTRATGASNPLVQDALWKRDPYRATQCNLQALREIDSRGQSFLRAAEGHGDWRLLLGSPEYSGLGDTLELDKDTLDRPPTDFSERTTPHAGVFF